MQYERIEIDYKAIDLGDENLNLNIKSNILKKTSDYMCSYSYTYTVPLTTRNKGILGSLLVAGSKNKKVKKFLPATYYRDGLKIFEGKCYVSGVELDSASVVFLFGINNALQDIKSDDVTLDKLWNDEDHDFHSVSGTTGIDIDYVTRKLPLSGIDKALKFADMPTADESTLTCPAVALRNTYSKNGDEWEYVPNYTRIPYAMRIKSIFEQMNKRYGLEVENLFSDGGRYLDDYIYYKTNTRRRGAFTLNSNGLRIATHGEYCRTIFTDNSESVITSDSMIVKDSDGGYPDFNFSNGIIRSFYSKVNIEEVTFTWSFNSECPFSGGFYYVCGDNGSYPIGSFSSGASSGTITFKPIDRNFGHVVTVGQMCYISALSSSSYDEAPGVDVFKVTFKCSFEEDNATQGLYNIFDTLPSQNAVSFISDYAFTVYGKFPINTLKGGNTLTFSSLEEIAGNKPYDWSDKLQNKDLKQYHTIDGLARTNWLKYAKDESETWYDIDHAFDKHFDVDDETLEDEEDYFETFTSYAVQHSDSECWLLEHRDDTGDDLNPCPRYMHLTRSISLNYGNVDYAQMQNSLTIFTQPDVHKVTTDTLSDPFRIECKIKLGTVDLATLDFTRPVYLSQLGMLFYIDEIKVSSNDICDVKLIRLKV